MIIIHDIEGSYGSAIQVFQRPGFEASAHYVVSYGGDVTQMVREHDIAWHAGNWDYNTRAIGIEHEGFAWTPGLYTTAEYDASARIAASICSRYHRIKSPIIAGVSSGEAYRWIVPSGVRT